MADAYSRVMYDASVKGAHTTQAHIVSADGVRGSVHATCIANPVSGISRGLAGDDNVRVLYCIYRYCMELCRQCSVKVNANGTKHRHIYYTHHHTTTRIPHSQYARRRWIVLSAPMGRPLWLRMAFGF